MALAIDPSYFRLAAGHGDGTIRFFDLSSLPACRCLHTVDGAKQVQRIADRAMNAAATSMQQDGASKGPVVVSAGRKVPQQVRKGVEVPPM